MALHNGGEWYPDIGTPTRPAITLNGGRVHPQTLLTNWCHARSQYRDNTADPIGLSCSAGGVELNNWDFALWRVGRYNDNGRLLFVWNWPYKGWSYESPVTPFWLSLEVIERVHMGQQREITRMP